jgi:hypothetical protein
MRRQLASILPLTLLAALLLGLPAGAQQATPVTGATTMSPVPGEYYELRGPGLLITVDAPTIPDVLPTLRIEYTYYPTAEPGEPPFEFPQVFTFEGPPESIQFFPAQGGRGRLLTVTVEAVPDAYTQTLTVLIPDVGVSGERATAIDTVAILTTHATSIGGPELVVGPLQTYQIVPLQGTVESAGP